MTSKSVGGLHQTEVWR